MVLGIGNIIMGDEGFGLHVIRRLKEIGMPDNIILEEGGVGGFELLGNLQGVDKLVVVDIMMLPLPPGELKVFEPGNPPTEPGKSDRFFPPGRCTGTDKFVANDGKRGTGSNVRSYPPTDYRLGHRAFTTVETGCRKSS